MNIRHLLTHTSGLSYGFFVDHPLEEDQYRQLKETKWQRDIPLSDFIEALAQMPLMFQPGTRWNYSMSTDVVGYLVQVISGMPLADFLQERIFKPLGMADTGFTVPAEKADRLAQIYQSQTLTDLEIMPPDEVRSIRDVTQPTKQPLGGSGLVTSTGDYLRFASCLLNGGELDGSRILGSRTLKWMTSNHISDDLLPLKIGTSPVNARFGLGFRVVEHIGESGVMTSKGAFGWGGAANTYFSVDPAEDMVLLFMTQHLPLLPYPVQHRFINMAYAAIVD